MKKVLGTNPNNWPALISRIALAIVVFPHGAQKLLGWYGGNGFTNTMNYLTTQGGLPYVVALLVILIESIGALMILAGFATRVAALGITVLFSIIAIQYHSQFGFFMNWFGNAGGEGIEYFILLIGLSLGLLISGGGKASVDSLLSSNKTNQ